MKIKVRFLTKEGLHIITARSFKAIFEKVIKLTFSHALRTVAGDTSEIVKYLEMEIEA